MSVLAEYGFAGATVDAIARRAGVSKGLMWHYFRDRDDLLEQTARQTLILLRETVGALIDLTAPAPEVIRAAIQGAASLRATHGAERRAMEEIVLNLRHEDGTLRFGLADYDDTYAQQAAIFRRGQNEGDFRADLDPLLLAVTYQGAVDSMLGYLDAHPDADPMRHATTVAEVLLGGVAVRRSPRMRRTASRAD